MLASYQKYSLEQRMPGSQTKLTIPHCSREREHKVGDIPVLWRVTRVAKPVRYHPIPSHCTKQRPAWAAAALLSGSVTEPPRSFGVSYASIHARGSRAAGNPVLPTAGNSGAGLNPDKWSDGDHLRNACGSGTTGGATCPRQHRVPLSTPRPSAPVCPPVSIRSARTSSGSTAHWVLRLP
jgi:hypothetical protein